MKVSNISLIKKSNGIFYDNNRNLMQNNKCLSTVNASLGLTTNQAQAINSQHIVFMNARGSMQDQLLEKNALDIKQEAMDKLNELSEKKTEMVEYIKRVLKEIESVRPVPIQSINNKLRFKWNGADNRYDCFVFDKNSSFIKYYESCTNSCKAEEKEFKPKASLLADYSRIGFTYIKKPRSTYEFASQMSICADSDPAFGIGDIIHDPNNQSYIDKMNIISYQEGPKKLKDDDAGFNYKVDVEIDYDEKTHLPSSYRKDVKRYYGKNPSYACKEEIKFDENGEPKQYIYLLSGTSPKVYEYKD